MRSFLPICAVLLLAISTSGPAWAQNLEPGLHLSLNAATFTGESNSDFNFRGAFGAGVSLGVPMGEGFLIQPEVRYTTKGAKSDNAVIEGVAGALAVTSTIAYLEIPLLVVYRFDRGGSTRPRVFAGPYVARKLDSRIEWRPASGGPRQSDSDDSVVKNDFGLVAGAGLEFDVSGEAVVIGARASFGLSDVRDRPDAPLHNTGFEVFAGLLLR